MAVPSSGELSLTGIALEMIQNNYIDYDPMGDGQNNLGETLIGTAPDFPQPTGDNGIYSPIYALYSEDPSHIGPSSNRLAKTRFDVSTPGAGPAASNDPYMLNDASTARAIADVSLAGMSAGAYGFGSRVGHPNSPLNPGPVTSAHSQTYQYGSGKFFTGTEGNSTIAYTIFRGNTDTGGINAFVFASSPYGGDPSETYQYVDPSGDVQPGGAPGGVPVENEVHPGSTDGINTVNPSANRPSNPSGQANMSEWYSYDHDAVALATAGFYASTALFTGDGGTSLYHYTKNISDFANGDVVNLPSDFSFSLVLMHKQAASGGQPYNADIQLTGVKYNGATYTLANPFPANWTPGGFTNWLYAGPGAAYSSQRTTSFDPTPATTAGAETVFNGVPSRTAVHPGSPAPGAAGKWAWQADGEGPSGGTGVPDPTGAFYWESSSGTRRNEWSILETPEIADITNDSITFSMYRFGAAIGTAFMGIRIIEA